MTSIGVLAQWQPRSTCEIITVYSGTVGRCAFAEGAKNCIFPARYRSRQSKRGPLRISVEMLTSISPRKYRRAGSYERRIGVITTLEDD